MASPPEMRYWLNWSELTGKPKITIEQYRNTLRQFPRSEILIACARFSIIFGFGPDANTVASQEATEYWAPLLFFPNLAPRALAFAKQGRPLFIQGQVRFLASEAMRLDPAHPEDGSKVHDYALGELLLAAGELMHKVPVDRPVEELDTMAEIVANFIPTFETDSITDAFVLFLRFYIYLTIIIPLLPAHKRLFDVDAEFEKVFGFPLDLYTKFVHTFTAHALLQREETKLGDVPEGSLGISWFKRTNLTEDQVSRMFDTVCCRLSDLPDTKKVHGYADFEFLKNNPYLRIDDKLYAIDYEHAVAKLESGALWRVAGTMEKNRRLQYFSFWGDVFEGYVNWLLDNYASKALNRCFPEPHYLSGKDTRPICDSIVICGSTAVLIEAKLATCRADVRYSCDRKLIREYLDTRLVDGTNRPVGVSQLVTAINRITQGPKDELPEWLRGIKKILPLIITRDDIGSSWMTNGYPQPMIRDWARKLIASEVDADPPSAQTEIATLRVYEKLRRQLCAPVGVDGFQALASRALSLAKSQSSGLSGVQVLANGALSGLSEIELQMNTDEDGEVGIILIAQLLRLFFTLLGEAATVRLIEDVPPPTEVKAELDTTGTRISATDKNYFGAFEDILLEADQLRHVSERLETLAHTHAGIDELMSVAGNIRNIATVLDVFTVIRSKGGSSRDSVLLPPTNDYLN